MFCTVCFGNVLLQTPHVTVAVLEDPGAGTEDRLVASYCLLLPGKVLHLSALLAAKRFRDKGNKDGAVRAIKVLQKAGLGEVMECKPVRGTAIVSSYLVK